MLTSTDISICKLLLYHTPKSISYSKIYVLIIHVQLSTMQFCSRFMSHILVFLLFAHDLHYSCLVTAADFFVFNGNCLNHFKLIALFEEDNTINMAIDSLLMVVEWKLISFFVLKGNSKCFLMMMNENILRNLNIVL